MKSYEMITTTHASQISLNQLVSDYNDAIETIWHPQHKLQEHLPKINSYGTLTKNWRVNSMVKFSAMKGTGFTSQSLKPPPYEKPSKSLIIEIFIMYTMNEPS